MRIFVRVVEKLFVHLVLFSREILENTVHREPCKENTLHVEEIEDENRYNYQTTFELWNVLYQDLSLVLI